ncbi:NAD-dependent epimerase/dehydratase family protein [Isoptericola sp. 178]|uniref:NAD-dependent epimerase/dehydratase family protein n=1 Tax=Isoptericola sp. 178 TaxID=3064651 RepID=UPI0027139355|nr:NAD-dependent epimerase/dehydratase family protein [Isoptericola sp. 178]MDO8145544.1 NAD-dependent epimerase/dehydratase family protein [Isoptericola sp. 178]
MRVVVIGASGNVGTAILRALAAEPVVTQIVGVARRIPRADGSSTVGPPHDAAEWVSVDLTDDATVAERLDAAVVGADAVVHLAWAIQPAREPDTLHRLNVDGTRAVTAAVVRNRVPHLLFMSASGVYSPGPADGSAIDEDWPRDGVPGSSYALQKAEVEHHLDALEESEPWLTVTRMRAAIMLQREAGAEIGRYFLGPLGQLGLRVATGPLGQALGGAVRGWQGLPEPDEPPLLPLMPFPAGLRLQVLHPDDTAAAVRAAVVGRHGGAFNLAPDGALTGQDMADLLAAGQLVELPVGLLRGGLDVASRARLVPIDAGWLDMAAANIVMDASRAREVLRWQPARPQGEVLLEVLHGVLDRASADTPPLQR